MCMEIKIKPEVEERKESNVLSPDVDYEMSLCFIPTKVVRSIGFVNREGIRLAKIRSTEW